LSKNNHERILADLVSVEAWFQKLTEQNPESDLFMHVRFQEAVFGSHNDEPVRFRIRLRRADITIVAEEPLRVPRSKVRRDRLSWINTVEDVTTKEKVASVDVGLNAKAGATGVAMDLEASAKASGSAGQKQTVTRTVQTQGMNVEHSYVEGNNRWTFSPAIGPHLMGHAFKETEPLMCLTLHLPMPKISPTVKVLVKCRREDIEVLNIEPKDIPKGILNRGMGAERKLKLAEEVIKAALVSAQLFVDDISEPTKEVTVADVLASEE
jgi:hypothetical protein